MSVVKTGLKVCRKTGGLAALAIYGGAALLHEPFEAQYSRADQRSFRILLLYPGLLLLGAVPERRRLRSLLTFIAFEAGLFLTLEAFPPSASTANEEDNSWDWNQFRNDCKI